jgi:very-short-patch-repair endonuclease
VGGTRATGIEGELSRHHRERERGGMVLSVLPGPDLEAVDYARWASGRGMRMIIVDERAFDGAARTILGHLPIAPLWRAARRAVAEAAGRSVEAIDASLSARSPGEWASWLAELAAGDLRIVASGWVLASLAQHRRLDVANAPLAVERLVPAIAALADPVAILVVPVSPTTIVSLADAIGEAVELCERWRRHAVALAAARSQLDELFAFAGDRAAIALARKGVIELEVANARTGKPGPALGGPSHAERTLHAALERDRRTHGRFALSHAMRGELERDGAAIGLYDAELALAVEVDGWHHFRDPDGYRRDREKDLVLQREGILVVRVLDEDVWHRLDHLVDQVASAVAERHRTRTVSGPLQPR